MKSYLKEAKINNKTVIFNWRYLLEHFKYKKEVN
jgi:hypothetical protein